MPVMLVYDQSKDEIGIIRNEVASACMSHEELDFRTALTIQELVGLVGESDDISVYCVDFDAGGEMAVKIVKDENPEVLTVIIVSSGTSPLRYVRPDIIPAGLLLRPLTQEQTASMLREVLETVWAKEKAKAFNNEVFTHSTREGVIRTPYAKILFFEARNKKVVLCTARSEQSFYATLDGLMDAIPGYFVRCHNGFIVNSLFVERVDLNQNQLLMYGGVTVPVSRSYRASVKEALT